MEEITAFTRSIDILHAQPVFTLFLIFGMGYLIGNIRIGSFSLGPVAGVLFAGLFIGQFGLRMPAGTQAMGFALFIFSVGYQAGPRFFDVLRTDGLKYFSLAVVIATTGFMIVVIAAQLLSLAPGTSAVILAGGLTNSPTLAAAQEAIRSGQVKPPEGITADAMIGNVATGHAITYIFGLAGLITINKLDMPHTDGDILRRPFHKSRASHVYKLWGLYYYPTLGLSRVIPYTLPKFSTGTIRRERTTCSCYTMV